LLEPQEANEKNVIPCLLLSVGSITILLAVVTVAAIVVARLKYAQQRKSLEQIIEMYHESKQALVRYVMLNRQCSEETAYWRIKEFVKKHVPLDEHSTIDRIFVQDRQSLLDRALSILVHISSEIDKI